MKFLNALLSNNKKSDNSASDHLEKNRLRARLEELCATYLSNSDDDILEFEASDSSLPYVVSILEEPAFLERFEFQQISETLFQIRQRELEIM